MSSIRKTNTSSSKQLYRPSLTHKAVFRLWLFCVGLFAILYVPAYQHIHDDIIKYGQQPLLESSIGLDKVHQSHKSRGVYIHEIDAPPMMKKERSIPGPKVAWLMSFPNRCVLSNSLVVRDLSFLCVCVANMNQ